MQRIQVNQPSFSEINAVQIQDFSKLKPSQAAVEAIQLVSRQGQQYLHRPEEFLDLKTVKLLVEEGKTSKSFVKLNRKLGNVFYNPRSVNISFLKV